MEIQWLHGYASMDMDISMDIHRKSVDMDMEMDMDGKFHIHGNPAKVTTTKLLCYSLGLFWLGVPGAFLKFKIMPLLVLKH